MATAKARALLACATLAALGSATSGASADSPRLTRDLPQVVLGECTKALLRSPLRFVCPPLVPVSKYRMFPGLHGAFVGNEPPAKIYALGFNGGDTGPTYWHWLAGMGTQAGVNRWVLSDAQNVVRGKPKLIQRESIDGHEVKIWRFPPHPAGGQFGGHDVAITRAGRLRAFASVHGDNTIASARMAIALAEKVASSSVTPLKHFDRNGISFQYPRSWFVTAKPLSDGVNPIYRFAVGTHAIRRTPKDSGPCLPGVAAQLPSTAVFAYLREALGADRGASLPNMQKRPRRFPLPTRSDNSLCGFERGLWIPFKSDGRAFYLGVYVGARASKANVAALAAAINGMKIEPR